MHSSTIEKGDENASRERVRWRWRAGEIRRSVRPYSQQTGLLTVARPSPGTPATPPPSGGCGP